MFGHLAKQTETTQFSFRLVSGLVTPPPRSAFTSSLA